MKHYLAIDAGTTRIKAGLVDETGKLIGLKDKSIAISMPKQGWCEMDMEELWEIVVKTIQALRDDHLSVWSSIAAIGIAAQGEGAWLLDEDKKPVRKAVLWNDTRNDQIPQPIWEDASVLCAENHVIPLCVGSPVSILHWLKHNEPDSYLKIEHVIFCKDWIKFKLTGNISTDLTDASTTAFDVLNHRLVPELFTLLGIDEMVEKMPIVFESGDIIGVVSNSGSISTGILEGTPVIAGSIDIASAAAGLGAVEPGESGSIIGTTLGNIAILGTDEIKSLKVEEGSVLCHVKKGSFLRQVSALSGAVVLDWCKRELGDCQDLNQLENEAKSISAGAEGIIFLPYLFGERAPFKAPNAAAAFSGIRFGHTRAHMVRAVYESLAYSLYDCRRYMPLVRPGINVAGGGAQSNLICQIISDLTGEKVYRSRNNELGLLGLYKLMSGNWAANSNKEDVFLPNEENTRLYREMYKEYCRLRDCFVIR
jgi:sugar (pentulose or hexulose) kinase